MEGRVVNDNGGDNWEDYLGRVLGGINGALNPGTVSVGGSTPTILTAGAGTSAATNYMPLLLIALVVVVVVVLSKR